MPLKGVQNWVNGWVNVNNNHVVFHEDDSSRHMQSNERSDSQRVSFGGQGSSDARMMGGGHGMMPVMGDGRAILDNRRGDNGVMYGLRPIERGEYSQNGTPTSPSKSKGSTAVTSTGTGTMTKSSQEPRQQQQQSGGLTTSAKNSYKKNNKKMKLKKTNSQSDLLKEKFASKREQKSDTTSIAGDSVGVIDTIAGLTQHLNRGYETTRRSSNSGSTTSTLMRDNKIHQTPVREVQNVGLGSNMNGSPPFRTTGQYVNELAFANQHRSSQIGSTTDDSSSRSLNRSQMKSTTGSNSSARSSSASKGPQHNYNYPGVNGAKHSIPTSMIGSAIHDQGFAPHQQHQPHQPQMHRNKQKIQHENSNNKTNNNVPEDICLHCKESDNKIAALESDLEYLRLVALKSEFICVECDNSNQTLPRNSSSASLASVKTSKSNRSTGRVSVTSGKHSITSGMYSSATGTSKRKDKKGRQVFADGMNHKLPEPVALAESSQRLGDITARYKRQIENMTRDTVSFCIHSLPCKF
jgi:hypothetical protein